MFDAMSVQAMAWVFDHDRSTSAGERLVLLSIANHANAEGLNSWPGIARIAREANLSERGARYALRRLEERGLIKVERNGGGQVDTPADRRPNRYTILPMQPDFELSTGVGNPGDGGNSGSSRGGQPATARGAKQRSDGGNPTAPEPSIEPSIEPRPGDETGEGSWESGLDGARRAMQEAAERRRAFELDAEPDIPTIDEVEHDTTEVGPEPE